MVGHGGSSASSYLADPTSPIPSHCASTVVTSTVRVNFYNNLGLCGEVYAGYFPVNFYNNLRFCGEIYAGYFAVNFYNNLRLCGEIYAGYFAVNFYNNLAQSVSSYPHFIIHICNR